MTRFRPLADNRPMAKRITRKDLKRNDLVETVGRTVGYVSEHRRGAVGAALAVAIVGLLIAGFFLFRAYGENEAGRELSAGLAALDTPIAGQPRALDAPKTYPSAAKRDEEALPHLRKAAAKANTAAGRAATVILAARDPKGPAAVETLAKEFDMKIAIHNHEPVSRRRPPPSWTRRGCSPSRARRRRRSRD